MYIEDWVPDYNYGQITNLQISVNIRNWSGSSDNAGFWLENMNA